MFWQYRLHKANSPWSVPPARLNGVATEPSSA
jgi:hypothetical protein